MDSSEAMKSHVSEQIRGKQEQSAYILQLERGIEDNKIERNSNTNELDQLENDLVPEETFEKKKNTHNKCWNFMKKRIYMKN